MSSSRAFARALVVLTVLSGAAARGQPASLTDSDPWVLVLGALRDEDAYESLIASAHWSPADHSWLALTAGRSKAPSTQADVTAGVLELDLEHDFGPAGLTAAIERWGDSDDLESRNVSAGIFVRRERYRVELGYESRAVDIYFASGDFPRLRRHLEVEADALGIEWRTRIGSRWQLYGGWMDYDYPARIRLVPVADRLDLLSESTVTLAYSFVDERASIGIERSFGLKLLNIDLARDRSAITHERLDSLGAAALWPIAPRIDFELSLGTSRSAGQGATLYGGIALIYYGGG